MFDHIEENLKLAQKFIADQGGELPRLRYRIKVRGIGDLFCLPENEEASRYWIMLQDIYYECGWHDPDCLLEAILELPEEERSLLPMVTEDGEKVFMYMVNQDGLVPLLLNNTGHFARGLYFFAASWKYIFGLKDVEYARVPEPLRTTLRFWDIMEVPEDKRLISVQDMVKSFEISKEDLTALMETKFERTWDDINQIWVYKNPIK